MELQEIENAIKICAELDLIHPVALRNWNIRKDYIQAVRKRCRYGLKNRLLDRLAEKYFLAPSTVHSIVYILKDSIKQRKILKNLGDQNGTKQKD